MNEVTFAQFVEKKVAKSFDTVTQDAQYYVHPTFCISNLSDYIRLITLISSANKDTIEWETVIYRGMVDESYDLLPGLARIENPIPDMEKELINDFLTRRPDAFRGLTDFDTLAKMQHYGLPTRLLDFSLNPLVGLYFACESKPSKNGRILCHGTYLKNDSSAYVNAICSAAIKKSFDDNYTVDEYLCDEKMSLKKYMVECYISDTTTVVRPKYWNQRIANQAGVFMVYPNNLRDRYYCVLKHAEELGINDAIRQYGRGKIDERKIQEAMRIEPKDNKGLEATSVLSDTYFRKIYDAYKVEYGSDKTWDQMNNRFLLTEGLKELSRTIIQDAFCSIIIEAKNKKRILRDLSFIGIGADYIYPELEYTAKEIRRKYE